MAKCVFGFDIGSYSLKIVKYNGSLIQRAVEAVLPENLVEDGRITSYDAMADFIKSVAKESKIGNGNAAVILPSNLAFVRRFELPLMTVDQLDLNLPYEFHDYLDMDKDKYFYDYVFNYAIDPPEVKEGEQEEAPKMDITAAAVPKDLIKAYREMFKNAGFKLVTAIPKQCAYANLIKKAKLPDDYECCFINLGHSRTEVDIFRGSIFQSGHSNDVAMSLETEEPSEIYAAISSDIRKALNFYKFSNRDSELEIAYCFGGGFKSPMLMNAIHSTTSFNLKNAGEILPTFENKVEYPGAFTLAIGAVLQ